MGRSWNDDWRKELETEDEECYIRLCDCRNTRKDIMTIAKLMCQYNKGIDVQDCLDRTLEWITDWNSQVNLYPDDDEYDKMLNQLRGIR